MVAIDSFGGVGGGDEGGLELGWGQEDVCGLAFLGRIGRSVWCRIASLPCNRSRVGR